MIDTRPSTQPAAGTKRARWRGWILPAALAALPWTWFAVRDLGAALDAVAVALPVVGVLAALVAFGCGMLSANMRFAAVSLSLLVFTAVATAGPRVPQPSPAPVAPFRLVAANTFDGNPRPEDAAGALIRADASVLVAVENPRAVTIALRHAFPNPHRVVGHGMGVFSTWPLEDLGGVPGVPSTAAARVLVDRPGAPFVVYAIHLPNPLHEISFSAHETIVDRLLTAAEREEQPVVLAGDFNMSDRTSAYRTLDGSLRDAMRVSWASSTYDHGLWALLQLRIDHVFVGRGLCAADPSTIAVPGSDHDGISVELGACP